MVHKGSTAALNTTHAGAFKVRLLARFDSVLPSFAMEKTLPLDGTSSIGMPLFDILYSVGQHHFGSLRHFEVGAMFWSLVRLFGHYERIVSVSDPRGLGPNHGDQRFLDADIESFIVRVRILLNDAGYVLRQLHDDSARRMPSGTGGVHPRNKEVSLFDLAKFFRRERDQHPELAVALEANESWLCRLRGQRDKVIHYKSKVLVVDKPPNLQFAMISAAGDEPTVATVGGGHRLLLTPVFDFVNGEAISLMRFLNEDLRLAIERLCIRRGWVYEPSLGPTLVTVSGIDLFHRMNPAP